MEDQVDVWIKTLRERTHHLTASIAALDMTTQALQAKVADLTNDVRRMSTADEIAQGVATELEKREVSHRKKVDSGMKRLAWSFGVVLTLLQIVSIIILKGVVS